MDIYSNHGLHFEFNNEGRIILKYNGRNIELQIQDIGYNINHFHAIYKQIKKKSTVSIQSSDTSDGDQQDHIADYTKNKQRSISIDFNLNSEFIIVGIDPVSQWSGLELKMHAFQSFVEQNKTSNVTFKLVQLVKFELTSEFQDIESSRRYLQELKRKAGQINQQLKGDQIIIQNIRNIEWEQFYKVMMDAQLFLKTRLADQSFDYICLYFYMNEKGKAITNGVSNFLNQLNFAKIVNPLNTEQLVKKMTEIYKESTLIQPQPQQQQ